MTGAKDVIDQFLEQGIIPDVLPKDGVKDWTPSILFSVKYPGQDNKVNLGQELTKEYAGEEPEIFLDSDIPLGKAFDKTYALALTDPDAPSRADPKYREFRHWVTTGLKLNENKTFTKTKDATTPYRPPGPPPGSGFHRYVFLLFEENSGGLVIPPGEPEHGAALEERRSWSAWKFGEKYGLKLVGASYFLVQG